VALGPQHLVEQRHIGLDQWDVLCGDHERDRAGGLALFSFGQPAPGLDQQVVRHLAGQSQQ
jgi:hypothetical protein